MTNTKSVFVNRATVHIHVSGGLLKLHLIEIVNNWKKPLLATLARDRMMLLCFQWLPKTILVIELMIVVNLVNFVIMFRTEAVFVRMDIVNFPVSITTQLNNFNFVVVNDI